MLKAEAEMKLREAAAERAAAALLAEEADAATAAAAKQPGSRKKAKKPRQKAQDSPNTTQALHMSGKTQQALAPEPERAVPSSTQKQQGAEDAEWVELNQLAATAAGQSAMSTSEISSLSGADPSTTAGLAGGLQFMDLASMHPAGADVPSHAFTALASQNPPERSSFSRLPGHDAQDPQTAAGTTELPPEQSSEDRRFGQVASRALTGITGPVVEPAGSPSLHDNSWQSAPGRRGKSGKKGMPAASSAAATAQSPKTNRRPAPGAAPVMSTRASGPTRDLRAPTQERPRDCNTPANQPMAQASSPLHEV